LGTELLRDFEPDPKEMSKLIVQSLVSTSGCTSMALNLFLQYMYRADDKIEMFNNECAAGSVNGMQPKKGDPTELPGFARLTADGSDVHWVMLCSAIVDRMCFVDASDMDKLLDSRMSHLKTHGYSQKLSKDELGMQEGTLFGIIEDAADAIDTDPPSERDRAAQLLKSICKPIRNLIKLKAAKKSKSKSGMTRTWILSQYETQMRVAKFLDDDNDGSDKNENKNGDGRPAADHSCPVVVGDEDENRECKTCSKSFVFTVGEQQFYADKKVNRKPDHCKVCSDKFKAAAKGKPCGDFAKGHCSFGKRCRFSHADDAFPVEDADDAAVAFDLEPEAEIDMTLEAAEFGTKEFNPYEMDAAAVAEIEDLAQYTEELMPDEDD
jgi:hypothetical protein